MTNIIRPICFSTANNDALILAAISRLASVSRVRFCALFSLKAQEIDVPLASMGRLAATSELHMFSLKVNTETSWGGQVCITSCLV